MAKTRISMVIPTYSLTEELARMALVTALGYREQVDELIITEDGGLYSEELRKLADVYIYNRSNGGFTKNVNQGWKMATGDFVMIVNSDTILNEGKLADLCIPGKVTSPEIVNQTIPRLAGPFWCSPKAVTEKYGMLMEEMKTYCSDSEYDNRIAHIFEKVSAVKIYHQMAQTVTAAGVEGQTFEDRMMYKKLKDAGEAI